MMNESWIKLHRKSRDSQVFSDPEAWFLFSWLLISVNWKDGWFLGDVVPAGSIATSPSRIADQLSWNRSKVRRVLDKLKRYGAIDQRATTRYTLVTLCNWSTYQHSDARQQQTTDQQPASDRPTTDQRPTINRPQ